jgi:hypothetical protein
MPVSGIMLCVMSTFTTIYDKCNDVKGLLIYDDVNDLFLVYMGARVADKVLFPYLLKQK